MIAELHKFLGLQTKWDYWGKGEKENWTFIKQKMEKNSTNWEYNTEGWQKEAKGNYS